MKQLFAKIMLPLLTLTGTAFGVAEKQEISLAPKYSNRVVALQPTVSYEQLGDDSVYLGVESFVTGAWCGENDYRTISLLEIRGGYTFSIDQRSRITPVVGASMFRDLQEWKFFESNNRGGFCSSYSEIKHKYPYIFHGSVGFMGEYDLCKTISVGLSAKGLMGKVWGAGKTDLKDMSYGLNASIPLTVRFGKEYNWDFRIEPLAILLKDYANYIGGKTSVAYRF